MFETIKVKEEFVEEEEKEEKEKIKEIIDVEIKEEILEPEFVVV
jgi:hypothetical protein